ncbi:MAG: helix-turn-helix domain-containing protein [Alphaproteobacteria bacterium]|jgi:transcriptional regulator with XRE-family HTH domain
MDGDLKYLIECQKNVMEAQRQMIVLQQQMLNKNNNFYNQQEKLKINDAQNGTFYGLKIMRLNKGWAQSDLARALKFKGHNIRQATISKWEAAKINPKLETRFKLAEVFDMSVEQLMEEVRDGCRQIDEMQGTHQPEDLIKSVGLKEWLIKNKKSQCWLSKSLKVSQPTISRWLKGQTTPLVHQAFEIEKITNGQVNCNSWGIN